MSVDFSLNEIATYLDAEIRGESELRITGVSTLQDASEGQLAFLANPKYAKQLSETGASAVILTADKAADFKGNCLIVNQPYLAYARVSSWFETLTLEPAFVHPSAVIDSNALVANDVYIGPNVVIEADAQIASGCHISANSYIGARSSIGLNGYIAANVTIYHDVRIGEQVRIHSGSVIGADGFGIAPKPDGSWEKIHQIGGVTIGDDVEIGACTTIDRGALSDTKVGDGVKLDNHVQIAHNAVVGDHTAMASYSGLAGSATIGRYCIMGGDACIVGHVAVCDNVQLTARTLVTKSISEPGSYSSGSTPLMTTTEWRKNSVRIGQLDALARRVKKLEE